MLKNCTYGMPFKSSKDISVYIYLKSGNSLNHNIIQWLEKNHQVNVNNEPKHGLAKRIK
jgi:hypothetical protein